MNKDYKVCDQRNNAIFFEGTEWECMQFVLEKYPDGEPGSEFMKIGINHK